MKKVIFSIILVLLLSGCFEVVEKPPDGDGDGNTPNIPGLDLNGLIDGNVNGDLNQPVDQNVFVPDVLTIEYCQTLENPTKIDACFYDIAIENLDISGCVLLTTLDPDGCILDIALLTKQKEDCLMVNLESIRNGCLNSVGIELKDISFCDEIQNNEDLKESCLIGIYPFLETSECKKISTTVEREECLFEEAANLEDYRSCALISGTIRLREYYRDQCLDQLWDIFEDSAPCSLYFEMDREQECYLDVAIDTNSVETCKKVVDSNSQTYCIKTIAYESEDPSACSEIENKNVRKECLEHFALNNPTLENCEAVTNPSVRQECYKEIAVTDLDESICDLILDKKSVIQTQCYLEIAKETLEVETCEKIFATRFDERDDCFNTIAFANLDFAVCEELHFGVNYHACFSSIALEVDNFGICDQMLEDYFIDINFNPKFGCYKNFAIGKEDTVYCELIAPQTIKDECSEEIEALLEEED